MSHFLGFDFSTQKLKALIIDDDLKILHESFVDFDIQLPEFRTLGGCIKGENGVVFTPVMLWIKALDLLLNKMKLDGVDFSKVKALCGAAQQHGSVYWQKNSRKVLQNLDSDQFLFQQLQTCFSLMQSPIWMDSSTTVYCKALEEEVGGQAKMADITGSRAYERFTASQIAKIVDQRLNLYNATERISLISSFACSLFLGDFAEIDYADASGMNLLDIKSKDWNDLCVNATKAPNLKEKLGKPVPSHTRLGNISKYFVERFGFNPDCSNVSFTGDNPATFAGMCLSSNDIAVSLGTSDTLMFCLEQPKNFINGHVMCSSVDENKYMGLLCFKNGSLTREKIRNLYVGKSWEDFNQLLNSTPRGNFGNLGLYFDSPEIFPQAKKGEYKWNNQGEKVMKFRAPEIEVRALIEGQFLARRAHWEDLGFTNKENNRIIATGGAAINNDILQVLSDVFNIPVFVQETQNSAALGAAYLAKIGDSKNLLNRENNSKLLEYKLVCNPNKDAAEIYDPMLKRYRLLIENL